MSSFFQYDFLLWLLLLLPILVAVYLYACYRKRQVFKRLGDPELVAELTRHHRKISFAQKFFLSLAAMALILLSIANLRTTAGAQQISRNGIDVMIALDVSKSMLAQDIKPTRLDRAKQLLNRLMDRMSDDRIGLVVFAGKSYLQMPLTGDHSAAKMYLAAATPETVPTQGTVIGDALKLCFASFNTKEKKYKAVILISDGEDHDENAEKIAGQMAQEGIIINTVGLGTAEGSPILDETTNELKKDNQGNTVITKINEAALAAIAKEGKGIYRLYTSTDAVVADLSEHLSTMDTRAVTDDSLVNYKTWFQYLLGIALLFLVIELFISEVKRQPRRRVSKIVASLLLPGFICLSAHAQSENEIIKNGNDAYKKKEFQTAAGKYDEAIKKNGTNPTARYNLGNALYKADKKDEAAAAYEKAGEVMAEPLAKSSALYNMGVAEQSANKTAECIVAYKNALKLDPANADARHNLQLALQQQKKDDEEKKKQDQKKKDNQGGDKKDNKKEQPPKPDGMSQKEAEQKLQALLQKEKELQDKFHKVNAQAPDRPEKDW